MGQFRRASSSLGYGRKPGYPERAHADMGRTCKLHTDSGPYWEWIFFLTEQNIKNLLYYSTVIAQKYIAYK